MRCSRYLSQLCGKVGVWACRIEKEGLGDVAGDFWAEGLNSCWRLVSTINNTAYLRMRHFVSDLRMVEGV